LPENGSGRRKSKKKVDDESSRRELKKRNEDNPQLGNQTQLILDFIEICSVLG
jgi:hypothetical protein